MALVNKVERPLTDIPALRTIGAYDKVVMAKPELRKYGEEASVTG
jgi:hypothetical protein